MEKKRNKKECSSYYSSLTKVWNLSLPVAILSEMATITRGKPAVLIKKITKSQKQNVCTQFMCSDWKAVLTSSYDKQHWTGVLTGQKRKHVSTLPEQKHGTQFLRVVKAYFASWRQKIDAEINAFRMPKLENIRVTCTVIMVLETSSLVFAMPKWLW